MRNFLLSLLILIGSIPFVQAAAPSLVIIKSQKGRFYGRILDAKTNKGIEAASVQIWQDGYDEETHEAKPLLKGGQLTESNGDFSIDNLPSQGYMKLKVFALGYVPVEKRVSFDVKFDKEKGFDIDAGTFDKDLGNIMLTPNNLELKEVVVKADEPFMKTAVDRKIYNVDKMTVAAGGTATDALKTLPGVNVDIDGNVTVRNAKPTIYVDGRPTNLTLEQIPANTIQSIEVITNPSAKYDASGNGGGILNIVLKKDKRIGYNGNIVAAIDRRLRTTNVISFNIREKKVNFFGGLNYITNKSIADGNSNRINNYANPIDSVYQTSENIFNNKFINSNIGFDWLINNRNTITVSYNYTNGSLNSSNILDIKYDSSDKFPYISPRGLSYANRNSTSDRNFKNIGSSFQYKKLFTKNGKEFTTDVYYSKATSDFNSFSNNLYTDALKNSYKKSSQQEQVGGGDVSFVIGQIDYTDPIGKKGKLESGIRTQISNFNSNNIGRISTDTTTTMVEVQTQTNNYNYKEQIHAAYATYTHELKKWNIQGGLRAESYIYDGILVKQDLKFRNYYPISLFPSVFASYKIDDKQDIQLNASRRVNRPNFFQLIPYTDFSDSLNLSKGNPGLKPEYSIQSEVSYTYTWDRKRSFIANAYYRRANNLITKVQNTEYNAELGRNIVVSTYGNANNASAYGVELNYQNKVGKKIEMNTNVNLYHSEISGNESSQTFNISRNTMFARYYLIYKYSKVLLFQVIADYQSKVSLQPDGSGSNWFSGNQSNSSAQGYQRQSGGLDLGIKYDFDLKKNKDKKKKSDNVTKPGSLILNFTDVLHTRRIDIYSNSPFFTQNSFYQRDWRMVRLTFIYKFGKFDTSLLRRKNQNKNSGPQMM